MVREGLAGLAVECGIRECRVPAPSAICFHVDGLGGNGWTIVRVITSSNNHLELAVLIRIASRLVGVVLVAVNNWCGLVLAEEPVREPGVIRRLCRVDCFILVVVGLLHVDRSGHCAITVVLDGHGGGVACTGVLHACLVTRILAYHILVCTGIGILNPTKRERVWLAGLIAAIVLHRHGCWVGQRILRILPKRRNGEREFLTRLPIAIGKHFLTLD